VRSTTAQGIMIHRDLAIDPHAGSAGRSGGCCQDDDTDNAPAASESPFKVLLAQEIAKLQS